MDPAKKKTVRLTVTFPRQNQSGFTLEKLGKQPDLRVNILRGRVSDKESSFVLEISGAARQLARILERVAQWGATVSTLAAGTSQP